MALAEILLLYVVIVRYGGIELLNALLLTVRKHFLRMVYSIAVHHFVLLRVTNSAAIRHFSSVAGLRVTYFAVVRHFLFSVSQLPISGA